MGLAVWEELTRARFYIVWSHATRPRQSMYMSGRPAVAEDRAMILAGDIGGTKTRLAFFATEGEHLRPLGEATFPSREYAGLAEIVDTFVSRHPGAVASAGFGIAGPVK